MDINNRTGEGTVRERYLRRINGLGKCLVLWAGQYSEFGSSDPWQYTELNVDHLMNLIDEMSNLADQTDKESVQFWKYLKILITR